MSLIFSCKVVLTPRVVLFSIFDYSKVNLFNTLFIFFILQLKFTIWVCRNNLSFIVSFFQLMTFGGVLLFLSKIVSVLILFVWVFFRLITYGAISSSYVL